SQKISKILELNRFINKWRKISDFENYQKKDHWASPLEFMTNGGDSEDFAIMKYISLKELGISPSNMRIVVTNDVLRAKTHTILSVHIGSKRYILDSQSNSILQEQFVKYYVPFYSVNETTRWAHVPGQTSLLKAPEGKNNYD
ncbi:MAG: transglutaminase-like cysteine peptidase, partial [Sneathiella sp.]|nr:transglutaminase-like cysteine peptidase [Sneathiella sp.]